MDYSIFGILILFIVIILILIYIYFYESDKKYDLNYTEGNFSKNKENLLAENYLSFDKDKILLRDNNAILIYGNVPRIYDYWSIETFLDDKLIDIPI